MEQLKEVLKQFQIAQEKEHDLEFIKTLLQDEATCLKDMLEEESRLEHELKRIKSQTHQLKEKIRSLWLPFVQGAEKAEIDLQGVKLVMQKITDVSIEEKELAVQWCLDNGYKDVCKFDVHTQTMKKIARDCFEEGTEIPGLNYKEVQILKIKE